MTVAATSKLAYHTMVEPTLGDRQQAVYDAIEKLGKASNEQIAEHLGIPINYVTGRVTELRRLGFVDVEGVTKNKSGASAKVWSLRDPFNDSKLLEQECEV